MANNVLSKLMQAFIPSSAQAPRLIAIEREKLLEHFQDKLETAFHLNRQAVSFQTNKTSPIYRWVKYKEGFSPDLVKYFLNQYTSGTGNLLDPFAGSGTALFAAQELGWKTFGIELLPVGTFIMKAREAISRIDAADLANAIETFHRLFPSFKGDRAQMAHISITKGAFPEETDRNLNRFLNYCASINDPDLQMAFRLAGFAILEEISYTRKDGQYLRWDHRSERNLSGKSFDKGKIYSFEEAITAKLGQIISDLDSSSEPCLFGEFDRSEALSNPTIVIEGSCLNELPGLPENFFDFVITSPPYCNRYDYTRTYALELVYLGYDTEEVRQLRQTMLSCTVENKEKIETLRRRYDTIDRVGVFERILGVYEKSEAMHEVNAVLAKLNDEEKLNNNNIPRMVRNYFLEMCFVIYELGRVLKSGRHCVMVNDNVRYGGEEIPVDLILSEFAENFGFEIERIFVLPRGKGNSSQQMGAYGRSEIRKCVYVWQKRP
jgi:DNA modification methylase